MNTPQNPLEGHSEDAAERSQIVQALATGSKIDPGRIKNFLLRAIADPQAALAGLAAHRQRLEETNSLNEQTARSMDEFKRRLEAMISQPAQGDEEFDVPMRFRKGAHFRSQRFSVDSAAEMIARLASE